MMPYKHIICIVVSLLCLISCNHTHHEVERLMGQKVHLPLDKMICWTENAGNYSDTIMDNKYIVYLDSATCSSCNIQVLGLWNELIDKIPNTQFIFIVAPHKIEDVAYIPLYLEKSMIKNQVYIDEKYEFIRSNPFFPQSQLYHTVLLNSKNEIVLVGNPLRNHRLEEMALSIVSGTKKESMCIE